MFDVKRVYLYCMGDSVLDKKKFSEDTANARFANRIQLDQNAQQLRQLQPFGNQADKFQPAQQQPSMLAGFIQNAVRLAFRPVAFMMQFAQNLPRLFAGPGNMLQNASAVMEKAVSQILTFFFGHKKDKTDEKEKREKNDFSTLNLFGERKVEQSNSSNLSGGQ